MGVLIGEMKIFPEGLHLEVILHNVVFWFNSSC